jgi:light-regulated signal transduction histidine kinase (bacteriophytochrome)
MLDRLRNVSIKQRTMGIAAVASSVALLVASAGFVMYEQRKDTDLASILGFIAIDVFAALVVALSLAFVIQRIVSEPVEQLQDALKKRSADAEAASRELSAFSYSVSHDLRAPLRTVDGFSEALIEDFRDTLGDQGVDYLNRIRGAAERMDVLIKSLAELAQISRSELRRERVDLSGIAASIATELKAADPKRDVQFSIEPGPSIEGDPRLLKIALEHLLGNSWKFTSKHPAAKIEVGTEQQNGHRLFYVRDDGAGFDSTFADKMFAPFQRFHPVKEFEGTGIGLAIVQRIIHSHEGKVWAVGEVEKGTTIYIEIE